MFIITSQSYVITRNHTLVLPLSLSLQCQRTITLLFYKGLLLTRVMCLITLVHYFNTSTFRIWYVRHLYGVCIRTEAKIQRLLIFPNIWQKYFHFFWKFFLRTKHKSDTSPINTRFIEKYIFWKKLGLKEKKGGVYPYCKKYNK